MVKGRLALCRRLRANPLKELRIRKLVLALSGAAALAFASGAQAAVTLTAGSCTFQSCNASTVDQSTTISFNDAALANSFNESFSFVNTVAGLYSITFGSSSGSVDILTATLTGPGGAINLAGPSGPDNIVNEQFSLEPINLAAGSYTFRTTGTRQGNGAGSVGGTLTVSAAVPEPATWALMLMGFGAVGFSMRRRRAGSFLPQAA